MVDSACRILRDGVLEGEFAPALMLRYKSLHASHGATSLFLHLVRFLASKVAAGNAQAKCLVFVAVDRHPEAYLSLMGFKGQQPPWLHFIDCYSDPLGWIKIMNQFVERADHCFPSHNLYSDLGDLSSLLSLIVRVGQSTPSHTEKMHFSIVIDSISSLLRHNSISQVARFLNSLRSQGGVSSMIWLLHSDLHETRIIASLEYISTIIMSVERSVLWNRDEKTHDGSCLYILKSRQKRRNGRVREKVEHFTSEGFDVNIQSQTSVLEAGKTNVPQIVEQVQFKLQLSDRELSERAKVILPFEHQGNGKESDIYNGRSGTRLATLEDSVSKKDPSNLNVNRNNTLGEVHYIRDSDDERPDSDEDPDDDLDI